MYIKQTYLCSMIPWEKGYRDILTKFNVCASWERPQWSESPWYIYDKKLVVNTCVKTYQALRLDKPILEVRPTGWLRKKLSSEARASAMLQFWLMSYIEKQIEKVNNPMAQVTLDR